MTVLPLSGVRVRSARLPSGITVKMHQFAEGVVEGLSASEAYRRAFDTSRMGAKSVCNEASRLLAHPGVSLAIDALRAEKLAREYLARLSEEQRIWGSVWQLAEDDRVPASIRVKALTLAAGMAGLLRKDRAQPEPVQTASEIDVELRQVLMRYVGQTEIDLSP